MANNRLKLIIEASAKQAAAEIKATTSKIRTHTAATARSFQGAGGKMQATFKKIHAGYHELEDNVVSLKGAVAGLVAGLAIREVGTGFLTTADSMDRMKISLDTITKGRGEETFRELNEWAMKMPVNTKKATEAYIQMRAMGVVPTIKDMTTLVDTMGALGGGSDMLDTFANTLGKMKSLGKVSAEEINRLGERGVPALEILQEHFKLTSKAMANLGAQGLDVDETIRVLLDGMAERFGGQADKVQQLMGGMWESIKSEYMEYQRIVMESGVTAYITAGLKEVTDEITRLKEAGELGPMAKDMADTVMTAISFVIKSVAALQDSFRGLQMIWQTLKIHSAKWALDTLADIELIVQGAMIAAKAFKPSWVPAIKAAQTEISIAQEYFTETVQDSEKELDKLASKKSAFSQVSKAIDKMRKAADDAYASLQKKKKNNQWTTSVTMKVAPRPVGAMPKAPKVDTEAQEKALKAYAGVYQDVLDKIRQATLSTEDYKIYKVRQWEAEAIEAAQKAGKDTADIERAAALEIADIQIQAGETRIKEREKAAAEEKRIVDQETAAAMQAIQTQLQAKRAMYDDLKAFGVDNYDIQGQLIDMQAKAFRDALEGNAEAQRLADAWEISQNIAKLEKRFADEHQVMEALRESWGLTWEEIHKGQVDVWADIASSATSATQSVSSTLANALVNSKNLGESIRNLFKTLAASAIQTLIQIGAQRLILSAIGTTAIGAEMSAQVVAMKAIFAAAAPAGMASAIATAGASAATGATAYTAAMAEMSGVTLATKAAMAGAAAFATGTIVTKPTLAWTGEDGEEAIVPLTQKYRSEGQAIFNQIAPIFAPSVPAPVLSPPSRPSPARGEGATSAGGGGTNYQIIIENKFTISGGVMGDESNIQDITNQIGGRVENAVRGALN